MTKKNNFRKTLFKRGVVKAFALASICSMMNESKAQTPMPMVGNWDMSTTSTVTLHNSGVGVLNPDGKMEVKYRPCIQPQNGLIITSLGCTINDMVNTTSPNYNTVANGGGMYIIGGTIPPMPPYVPVNLTMPASFNLTSALVPLVNNNTKPMFWVRDENPGNAGFPGSPTFNTYNTQFIVLPSGNTGINTNNPRASLDVVQKGGGYNEEPTAIFGKHQSGTQTALVGGESGTTNGGTNGYRTKQIMVFNQLRDKEYNRIVNDKDQALLFTDGLNSDGSNLNSALVIAPWASNYQSPTSVIGGIRISKDGNVEVHGNLRTTKLIVNAKWWSDFVFASDYKLMTLSQVSYFIKTNGHLPGMPSEKEVLDSGLNIGDMQALQQQKIEELTLYTIAQDEKIAQQELALKEQEERLKAIEAKLNSLTK